MAALLSLLFFCLIFFSSLFTLLPYSHLQEKLAWGFVGTNVPRFHSWNSNFHRTFFHQFFPWRAKIVFFFYFVFFILFSSSLFPCDTSNFFISKLFKTRIFTSLQFFVISFSDSSPFNCKLFRRDTLKNNHSNIALCLYLLTISVGKKQKNDHKVWTIVQDKYE